MQKVIIAGSRDFYDYSCAERQLLNYFKEHNLHSYQLEIISGGARGVDKIGEQFANKYNIKLTIFPANWEQYGKKAGYLRNLEMAEYCENGILIAFWDGKSKGTKHMIDIAINKKLKVVIFEI